MPNLRLLFSFFVSAKTFFLVVLLSIPDLTYSQHNNFTIFSIQEGLPQSEVMALCQDSRGYLWIGTMSGGIALFDGINFKCYTVKDGLSGNKIYSILQDSHNRIWIGTDNGLTLYDGYRFTTYTTKNGLTGNNIFRLFEDSRGWIWLGTNENGATIIKDVSNHQLRLDSVTSTNGLEGKFVTGFIEDKLNRVWIATLDGSLNVSEIKDKQIKATPLKMPFNNILSMQKNLSGDIWVGTYLDGAYLIDTKTDNNVKKYIRKITFNHSDVINRIWNILVDSDGNVWFATDKSGLVKYDINNNINYFTKETGLPNNQILCLLQDNERNLWMGTQGGGICKFNGEYLSNYIFNELKIDNIYSIAKTSDNTFWAGTSDNGLLKIIFDKNFNIQKTQLFNEKDGLIDLSVTSIATADKNSIWLGTKSSGLFFFNGREFFNYTSYDGLVNNNINALCIDMKGRLWIGTGGGLSIFNGSTFFNITEENYQLPSNEVITLKESPDGAVWAGTLNGMARFINNQMTTFDEEEGLYSKNIKTLEIDTKGNVWIGAFGSGLFLYQPDNKSEKPIKKVADYKILGSDNIYSLSLINDSMLIVATDKGFKLVYLNDNKTVRKTVSFDKTNGYSGIENNLNAILNDENGNIWFGNVKGLSRFNKDFFKPCYNPPLLNITNLKLFFNEVDWKKHSDSISPWYYLPYSILELSHNENHLTFAFTGISLSNPQKIKFRYILEGHDKFWSPEVTSNEVVYSGLSYGEYTFKVLSCNENGIWNNQPVSFPFVINPPWFKTWWAITSYIVLLIIIMITYIKLREAKLKRDKILLQKKVDEQTKELASKNEDLQQQNTEIAAQRDEIEQQRNIVISQNEILEIQKKEITDSIHYASKIQKAVLPINNYVDSILNDYFILYKPRDIVSGDFYWLTTIDNKIIFTIADCTGHGVPGAFMSLIGISSLNEIVNEKRISRPDLILNELRSKIVNALQQQEGNIKTKDGMDMSLVCINQNNKSIQYAGANNSLFIIRNNDLTEIKPDKMPIGIYDIMTPFNLHEFNYNDNDILYLFSDGYADQFGGPRSKKFMIKNTKALLLQIAGKATKDQKEILLNTITKWQNESNEPQNDDICIAGIRLH